MVTALQTSIDPFGDDTLALAGIAPAVVGLVFKVAAVPFHVWARDVNQGAPTPVTCLWPRSPRRRRSLAMIRVLVVALPFYKDDWRPIIWVLALVTLLGGSILAVVQDNVKRMLGYSSISHAGFILVGVEAAGHGAGDPDPGPGVPAVVLYLILYSVLVIGSFAVITIVSRSNDGNTGIDSFKGLAKRRPALALGFTVLLLGPGRRTAHERVHRQVRSDPGRGRRRELCHRRDRHGVCGDRRVPVPADHGVDVGRRVHR